MTFRFEYFPNQASIDIHLSEEVVESYTSITFSDKWSNEIHLLHSLVKGCKGVTEVSFKPYSIHIQRAAVFSKETVAMNVIEALKQYFDLQGISTDWEQLPTIRTDIACTQCPNCKAEKDAAMEDMMDEFETMDWD
jgi:hypothetical protein